MDAFVLDCSVTVSWCFENQTTALSEEVLQKLEKGATAFVPQHWAMEVGNALLVGERRKQLDPNKNLVFMNSVIQYSILVDSPTSSYIFNQVYFLAREHTLSSYDAVYLELAFRKGLPLATRDEALRKAAKKIGVRLL